MQATAIGQKRDECMKILGRLLMSPLVDKSVQSFPTYIECIDLKKNLKHAKLEKSKLPLNRFLHFASGLDKVEMFGHRDSFLEP